MPGGRWSADEAADWHLRTGWLAGCNFVPSTAVNQLEMWQVETFDLPTIDRELGFAEALGFNSMRVFLHDLLWAQDSAGFLERMQAYLEAAEGHGIGTVFVLFDSVWDPNPRLGKQPEPRPGLHNSGWVQSPGAGALAEPATRPALEGYVTGVLSRFAQDARVHGWDLVNEPDNTNAASYGRNEPANKDQLALGLVRDAFDWAWSVRPSQPVTTGVWSGEWSTHGMLSSVARLSIESSDIVSFHSYGGPARIKECIAQLQRYGRPIACTEYMARPAGSTFDPILGLLKDGGVHAYNWGLVAGKSQTIYPWESWAKPSLAEPAVWFHDIVRADGTPFDPEESRYIRSVTGR